MNKKCFVCKKILPISDYSISKKNKDGLRGTCKSCQKLQRIKWIKRTFPSKKAYSKYTVERLKKFRKKFRDTYGIGSGFLWRYGLEISLAVLKRDNNSCKICGKKEQLTFHHLNGKGRHYKEKTGMPMDNRIENLQVLCRKCHGSIDGKKKRNNVLPSWEERGF